VKSYAILKNKHSNESAFIVGAGASLLNLYRDQPLHRIFEHVVIAVNSAIWIMPWGMPHPNLDIKAEIDSDPEKRYWISNDALCRAWNYFEYVKRCNATKIVRNSWKKYYKEIPDFLEFCPRETPEEEIDPEEEGLAYCSSIPSGIDLALQMGCKKIFLLGVDQHFVPFNNMLISHFWEFNSKPLQPQCNPRSRANVSSQARVFPVNLKAYHALANFADYKNAIIYNCNSGSKVKEFIKISFQEALDMF
jgi:hypothetical protein|tara:strand:+ start:3257 stop:4003 length:747 start_codon:yes stop_codon:yes gene_type:complete